MGKSKVNRIEMRVNESKAGKLYRMLTCTRERESERGERKVSIHVDLRVTLG